MADYSAPCAEVMELRHSPIRWADVQLIAILADSKAQQERVVGLGALT